MQDADQVSAGAEFQPGLEAEQLSPHEVPSLPVGQWLRKNLFSNWANGILTLVGALAALVALRGVLNFVFSENRQWDAVRTNLRALMTLSYPESQYIRVWVSLGFVVGLAGLSAGIWANWGGVPLRRVSTWLMGTGALLALCIIVREPSVILGDDGKVIRTIDGSLRRESFMDAMVDRSTWWIAAVLLLAVGAALWSRFSDPARRRVEVSVTSVVFVGIGLAILSLWIAPYGHYAFISETKSYVAEPGRTVAFSTKMPWTVMWILLSGFFLVGRSFQRGRYLGFVKGASNLLWLISPLTLFWVVLRDPALDYGHVISTDLPMGLAFGVLGGTLLWGLTRTSIGEAGRITATLLLGFAVFNWVAAFFGWYPMLQKARISFLLLALAALLAPNFIGELAKRRQLVLGWLGVTALVHYLATMINTPSTVELQSTEFLGGLGLTLFVALIVVLLSFPLGVLLALGRTSKFPIFRMLSTSYIEVIRGVPLISVLIFFSVMVPLFLPDGMELAELAAVLTGYTLFSAAYLAENVRGGLQSITKGQYEAADAIGLTPAQRTGFIVLPQALTVSIPQLVGQVISTFKETSLLAIIGLFDFLRVANSVIPAQSEFMGVKREGILLVAMIYFFFNFTISKYSQRLERRVGLGER
ncbi:MAG: amino acid ABC transporter permease [Acidimicrobiales bacterium]|jgi:general L-amino acid transport system permease protein|nr:amino acid ABC transporter permease [Acidimicrobiales bacterium]